MTPWDWQSLNLMLALRSVSQLGLKGVVVMTLIGAFLSIKGHKPTVDGYVNSANYDQQFPAKYHSAMQDYNQALKLDPQSADAYAGRGNLYLRWSKYLEKANTKDSSRKMVEKFNLNVSNSTTMKNAAIADYSRAKALYQKQGEGYHTLQLTRVINHVKQGEDYPFRFNSPG